MKRVLIGALMASVAMFFWGFLFWGVSTVWTQYLRPVPDQAGLAKQLLESIPSRSFPETELLIIVRRNYIALYEHLQRWVVGAPSVKVLVERRATDRRSATCPVTDERRRVRTRRIRRALGETVTPR
jgi:hypothetical protein